MSPTAATMLQIENSQMINRTTHGLRIDSGEHLIIESPAFNNHAPLPSRYTAAGEDLSPPLAWKSPPNGTLEFAIIMDDPDAPGAAPWIHWVAYKIPPSLRDLPEGISLDYPGISQGMNSWGVLGYRGPNPPPGKVHHYRFTVYALNHELGLSQGVTALELKNSMQEHILERQILTGCYSR